MDIWFSENVIVQLKSPLLEARRLDNGLTCEI